MQLAKSENPTLELHYCFKKNQQLDIGMTTCQESDYRNLEDETLRSLKTETYLGNIFVVKFVVPLYVEVRRSWVDIEQFN